jgi:uncharacterized protein
MNAKTETVLVTGSTVGIGLALSRVFAAGGSNLILVARNREKLDQVAQELRHAHKIDVAVIPMDLAAPGSAQALFDEVAARGKVVDVLVNNAGMGVYGPFAESAWQQDGALLQLNVFNLTHLTRLFVPGMIERRRGGILNVASTAAFQPGPLMALYYASKAYVLSFSEALHDELQGTGVRATALCPGPVATEFFKRADMENSGLASGKVLAIMSAERVAQAGYRGFRNGTAIVIPGFLNKLGPFSLRFTPRFLVRTITRWINSTA